MKTRHGDGMKRVWDMMPWEAILGETTSWLPREKPRQTERWWNPEVVGPGDRDCQPVEGMGRDRR